LSIYERAFWWCNGDVFPVHVFHVHGLFVPKTVFRGPFEKKVFTYTYVTYRLVSTSIPSGTTTFDLDSLSSPTGTTNLDGVRIVSDPIRI
jgi:hypothetical protein